MAHNVTSAWYESTEEVTESGVGTNGMRISTGATHALTCGIDVTHVSSDVHRIESISSGMNWLRSMHTNGNIGSTLLRHRKTKNEQTSFS